MNRRILFMALAVATALAFTTPASPQGGGQFAGAFTLRGDIGNGLVGTAFIAFHSDGTVTQTSGNPVYSSIHGVWEKIGPKTIRVTTYTFITTPTGFWGIGRSRAELEFTNDFSSYKGTSYLEGVPCSSTETCPDPLDPHTPWYAASTPLLPLSGTRMEVLRAGPLP
jgi:hypothetical protein